MHPRKIAALAALTATLGGVGLAVGTSPHADAARLGTSVTVAPAARLGTSARLKVAPAARLKVAPAARLGTAAVTIAPAYYLKPWQK